MAGMQVIDRRRLQKDVRAIADVSSPLECRFRTAPCTDTSAENQQTKVRLLYRVLDTPLQLRVLLWTEQQLVMRSTFVLRQVVINPQAQQARDYHASSQPNLLRWAESCSNELRIRSVPLSTHMHFVVFDQSTNDRAPCG